MSLTTQRDTNEIANGGKYLYLPVKGNTTIYQGAIVALDADGYAVAGKAAAGLRSAGRAEETVANTLTDGAVFINVSRGTFIYSNSATEANKVTAADVLKPCYIEDDQSVTTLATETSVAGLVISIEEDGVAVELGSGLTA